MKRNFMIACAVFIFMPALCSLGPAVALAQENYVKEADNFIILFDASHSMTEADEATGEQKIVMAKEALLEMNRQIPDLGFNAGVYVFTPQETYLEVGPYNPQTLAAAVRELGARNVHIVQQPTPLGWGIRELGSVLKGLGGRTVVFLFSDGQNTDKLNPVIEARALAGVFDVCFLIISYADENKPQRQALLRGIADVNECSRIIDFADFIQQPGLCTGELCTLPVEVVAVAPGDSDGDGVPDNQDKCPGTRPGYAVDSDGCMIPARMQPGMVHFQFDESFIEDQFHDDINAYGRFLENHEEAVLILAGHTDAIGTEEYNMGLSERRAMSVRDYLARNFNIDRGQIELNSYGEHFPIAPNDTPEGRRMNRRTKMVVSGAYQR